MRPSFTVAVDARPLSHPQPGGFRSYVRALLHGLRDRQTAGETTPRLLLYLDRPPSAELAATLPPDAETRLLSPNRLRTDFRLFAAQVRADRPDLVFGTQNYLPPALSAPTALALHDALGIKRYPWADGTPRTLRERMIHGYWRWRTLASARRARRIVSASRGACMEIRSVLTGLPASRFAVVPIGIALPQLPFGGERDADTLLALASPDPRKNLALLYDALAAFPARFGITPRLRIVCTSATVAARTTDTLAPFGIHAELLTGLNDDALSVAFARAAVFVFPSRLEGFGLPPLEMMATGGAVAASDAAPMPEVLGDAPVYFSPDSAEGLADGVGALLANPAERAERGERGRARAAAFTCRRMADETIAVWESAVY